MEHCKNCGKQVHDAYCSYCGQKTRLERISLDYVWHELFHFFTHIERGFLFTSFSMLANPGKVVTDYIEGKRKIYQPPVSYFLIWTTLFILTLYVIGKIFGENQVIDYNDYFGPGSTTRFAISNLSFMLTLIIPFQALYLYILITHRQYNYFETLVAAIYVVGTIILLQFAFAILSLVFYVLTSRPVDLHLSDIFKAGFFIWFIYSFLRVFTVRHALVKGILFILLAAGTFSLWRIYGVPILAGYFIK